MQQLLMLPRLHPIIYYLRPLDLFIHPAVPIDLLTVEKVGPVHTRRRYSTRIRCYAEKNQDLLISSSIHAQYSKDLLEMLETATHSCGGGTGRPVRK